MTHILSPNKIYIVTESTWGLSGHRARRRVADSQGPVSMAGLSLNKIGDRGPTPQPQGVKCG